MPTPPDDALVEFIPREQFDALVLLYDRFAHSLDPFDRQSDEAEKAFNAEILSWYDGLPCHPKPPFRDFRRALIQRCKRRIVAERSKPPST
jgi:hypothetical protein